MEPDVELHYSASTDFYSSFISSHQWTSGGSAVVQGPWSIHTCNVELLKAELVIMSAVMGVVMRLQCSVFLLLLMERWASLRLVVVWNFYSCVFSVLMSWWGGSLNRCDSAVLTCLFSLECLHFNFSCTINLIIRSKVCRGMCTNKYSNHKSFITHEWMNELTRRFQTACLTHDDMWSIYTP